MAENQILIHPNGTGRGRSGSLSIDENATVDSKNRWLFDLNQDPVTQSGELASGRVKAFLYEALHRAITKHNLRECFRLLGCMPKDTSLDPYVLFRYIMILVDSNQTELVNKNVIFHLESEMSKLDLGKQDIFVEFLNYFIRYNRIEDARELFAQRHRFMAHRIHRILPFVDVHLCCYEFLLNYLDWNDRAFRRDKKLKFDVSIQGWIVNTIDTLKLTKSNHEYFVICLLRVLLFYGYHKKAYLFASEFQRNNPDNISAQLILHYLLNQIIAPREGIQSQEENLMECELSCEELNKNRFAELETINNFSTNLEEEIFEPDKYPVKEDKRNIISNLRRLDPSRGELLELGYMHDNQIDALRDLMDGMETLHEIRNMSRWKKLHQVIENIFEVGDEVLITDAKFLWHTRYRIFWISIDFISLAGDKISTRDRKLIKKVIIVINNKLDRPIRQ